MPESFIATFSVPRALLLFCVAVTHLAMILLLASRNPLPARVVRAPLIAMLLAEPPAVSAVAPAIQPALIYPMPLVIEPPNIVVIDEPGSDMLPEAQFAAPQWMSSSNDDLRSMARAAGVSEGANATVVLRVEVLPSGAPGIVSVEVSSGDSHIDAVAIAYAQSQRWLPGMISGMPVAMRVRWAVHVAA